MTGCKYQSKYGQGRCVRGLTVDKGSPSGRCAVQGVGQQSRCTEHKSLTKLLEDGARLAEDDVEVPAPSEGSDRRFRTVALPADDPNLDRPVFALWERLGNADGKGVSN